MRRKTPELQKLEYVANVFAALGSPTRFRLLLRLVEQACSVNNLASSVGAKQANVSQQLGILKRSGLVRSIRTGSTVTYSTDGPEVNQIIKHAVEMLQRIITRRCTSLHKTTQ